MANRFMRKLSFGKKLMLTAAAVVAVAGPIATGAVGSSQRQAQSQQAPAAPPATGQLPDQSPAQAVDRPVFDVASIKPSAPDERGGWARFLPGGRFEVINGQLIFVIQQLYGLRDFQIVDAPKWISDWKTARFDIEAKSEGVSNQDRLRLMAQNLLADRFQLKVHRETRQMPVYVLIPGKNGVKVKPTPDNGKPRGSGAIEWVELGRNRGSNVFMDSFIGSLARSVDRPILDGTKYTEAFTFDLIWDQGVSAAPPAGPGASAMPDQVRPSLFTALQEQMGLKLDPQKAPVEVLVIDRVERPSEN